MLRQQAATRLCSTQLLSQARYLGLNIGAARSVPVLAVDGCWRHHEECAQIMRNFIADVQCAKGP